MNSSPIMQTKHYFSMTKLYNIKQYSSWIYMLSINCVRCSSMSCACSYGNVIICNVNFNSSKPTKCHIRL